MFLRVGDVHVCPPRENLLVVRARVESMSGKFEELESAAKSFNRSSELDSIVITPGPRLAGRPNFSRRQPNFVRPEIPPLSWLTLALQDLSASRCISVPFAIWRAHAFGRAESRRAEDPREPVVEARRLSKGFGDRLLISDAMFERLDESERLRHGDTETRLERGETWGETQVGSRGTLTASHLQWRTVRGIAGHTAEDPCRGCGGNYWPQWRWQVHPVQDHGWLGRCG